jgi:hypothetical protein
MDQAHPVAAPQPAPKSEHPCCPEVAKVQHGGEEQKQDDCCCELTSAPDVAPAPDFVLPVQAHVHLALPEPLPEVPEAVLIEASESTPFYSDQPPPPDHALSVRGRAPPVA